MHRFILLLFFSCLFSVTGLMAQTDDIKVISREVIVPHHDSLERARISVKTPKRKVRNPKKFYYWFYSGHININQGAYNENPLNGHYFVYNKNKQLITKGYFNNGKKGRKWMYWYVDGTLKRTERWHWGYQWGKTKIFNDKGQKIAKFRFWKGIQSGKQRFYQGDSFIVKRYIKGKEIPVIVKMKHCKDSCAFKKTWKKLVSKKNKTDSIAVEKPKKLSNKTVIDESKKEPVKQKLSKEEKEAQKALKKKEKAEKELQKEREKAQNTH
jgi:hypothetical protein